LATDASPNIRLRQRQSAAAASLAAKYGRSAANTKGGDNAVRRDDPPPVVVTRLGDGVTAKSAATKQARSGWTFDRWDCFVVPRLLPKQPNLAQGKAMTAADPDRGAEARRLIRGRGYAALATSFAEGVGSRPYASLVATACDSDASPLLLLSDLAQHTRNLAAEPRVSLLFEDTADRPDPLAGPRLTLLGRAGQVDDPRLAARFAARHPASADYAGFADFHLYRVAIERGHLVAGFGRIAWIEGEDLRFPADASALAAAEPGIVSHMNTDRADAVARFAEHLLGRAGTGWQMTGIDPEGIDLRRGSKTARLDFAAPVLTPSAARRALAALAEAARKPGAGR
jgi:heme oxygenase (biliverdin-IX-beta and delta-forming)